MTDLPDYIETTVLFIGGCLLLIAMAWVAVIFIQDGLQRKRRRP